MERAPKENRFEFVVLAGKRARQLLAGAVPREEGDKKIAIAQKEILRRKVVKVDDAQYWRSSRSESPAASAPIRRSRSAGACRSAATTWLR